MNKLRKTLLFLSSCPCNWAKTVVPEAKIGEYVTIARKDRESDNWFVGSITGANARNVELPLSFLDADTQYVAKIFVDGEKADYQSNPYDIDIKEVEVDSKTVLNLKLARSGGAAIMIMKK